MGTYMKYQIEDKSKVDEVNKILHQLKDEQGCCCLHLWDEEDRNIELKKVEETGCGCPDYLEIGQGCLKLFSSEEKEMQDILKALVEVKNKYGLILDMPTNIARFIEMKKD
jgi:hypothetical protein